MDRSPIHELIRSATEVGSPPACPEVRIHLARALTPLLQAYDRLRPGASLAPPYWAYAWSGGQALARHLLDSPWLVRGRRVLDFCAGSGIAGIAAALAGAARVDATDPDPVAIEAIMLNAEINDVEVKLCAEDVTAAPTGVWDVILAGEVLYESPAAERCIPWLRQRAAQGSMIIMADPCGSYRDDKRFVRMADYDIPVARGDEVSLMLTLVYRLAGTDASRGEDQATATT